MSEAGRDEVRFRVEGPLGIITMTRPKALNALTLPMIRLMAPQLAAWAEEPAVKAVAIEGEGERAFCAGGDVRAVWSAAKEPGYSAGQEGFLAADFFREEYRLNRQIHTYAKPFIALIDGVTMGGGVGLSIHGDLRIATERTLFAMPETAIGLFPDVGGHWFLPRLPGAIGLYLALTGDRLKAADCLTAEIATHYVPAEAMPAVLEALKGADWSQGAAGASAALGALTAQPEEAGHLPEQRERIDRCFGGKASVEEVVAALKAEDDDWARGCLETMGKRSPTSMKLSFEQLRRGATMDFDAGMQMEYRLSQWCMRPGSDFFEGIRAVLVDKDHAPTWSPDSLAGVTDDLIQSAFDPLPEGELTF